MQSQGLLAGLLEFGSQGNEGAKLNRNPDAQDADRFLETLLDELEKALDGSNALSRDDLLSAFFGSEELSRKPQAPIPEREKVVLPSDRAGFDLPPLRSYEPSSKIPLEEISAAPKIGPSGPPIVPGQPSIAEPVAVVSGRVSSSEVPQTQVKPATPSVEPAISMLQSQPAAVAPRPSETRLFEEAVKTFRPVGDDLKPQPPAPTQQLDTKSQPKDRAPPLSEDRAIRASDSEIGTAQVGRSREQSQGVSMPTPIKSDPEMGDVKPVVGMSLSRDVKPDDVAKTSPGEAVEGPKTYRAETNLDVGRERVASETRTASGAEIAETSLPPKRVEAKLEKAHSSLPENPQANPLRTRADVRTTPEQPKTVSEIYVDVRSNQERSEPIKARHVMEGDRVPDAVPRISATPKPLMPLATNPLAAPPPFAEIVPPSAATGLEPLNVTGASSPTVPARDIQPMPVIPSTAPAPSTVNQPVVMQITQAIAGSDNAQIQVQLSPEELGSVRIVMSTREAGMQVVIFAERSETLDLLRRDEAGLAADLASMGFSQSNLKFEREGSETSFTLPDDSDEPAPEISHADVAVSLEPIHLSGLDLRL